MGLRPVSQVYWHRWPNVGRGQSQKIRRKIRKNVKKIEKKKIRFFDFFRTLEGPTDPKRLPLTPQTPPLDRMWWKLHEKFSATFRELLLQKLKMPKLWPKKVKHTAYAHLASSNFKSKHVKIRQKIRVIAHTVLNTKTTSLCLWGEYPIFKKFSKSDKNAFFSCFLVGLTRRSRRMEHAAFFETFFL